VEKEGLPREQPVLHLLLRMLALGLSAWEMIETQDFRDSVAHLAEISAT
jgi:negative elongation factor B